MRNGDLPPGAAPTRSGDGRIGVAVVVGVAIGNVALWLLARPAGQPGGRYVGELCSVEALFLFSCVLVFATLLPSIERAFGGLDRVAVWHRRVAMPRSRCSCPIWRWSRPRRIRLRRRSAM